MNKTTTVTKDIGKSFDEIAGENQRFRTLAEWSKIPIDTHMAMRLWNFVPMGGKEDALKAALKYVAVVADQPQREHHFLTLSGEVGRGKTHLAFGIGWHFLEQKMGIVSYWRVTKFLDNIREWYDLQEERRRYGGEMPLSPIKRAMDADLLILDDLGMERPTEWAIEKLEDLIDDRWLNKQLTVVTTNVMPDKLTARVRSRIKEGVTVVIGGVDFRELRAKQRNKANNND